MVGLGFGDEGKGHVVDWLCANAKDPCVTRFCGGPQAAHHVVLSDGTDHVFSHFGSGTLRGAPTNWSRFCPVNPVALINEFDDLKNRGYTPRIYIDPQCPVVTPFEQHWNDESGDNLEHGTCGAGIFATKRREDAHYHVWFEDLFHPIVLEMKLALLAKFYGRTSYTSKYIKLSDFLRSCDACVSEDDICTHTKVVLHGRPHIFEGSQGLMLDQSYGFFPHVTPSNTGMTNVIALTNASPTVWLVTRAYQTRHGAGPMSLAVEHGIKDNPYEKNRDDGAQGEFRKTLLDLDLVRYAVSKDPGIRDTRPNLVVTCMDLLDGHYRLIDGGRVHTYPKEAAFLKAIASAVGAAELYVSYGPTAEDIKPSN